MARVPLVRLTDAADARQSIGKIAKILTPMQQTKIGVNAYTDQSVLA